MSRRRGSVAIFIGSAGRCACAGCERGGPCIVPASWKGQLVRATCCNYDVPEFDIVWREVVAGELFACCRECSEEAIEAAGDCSPGRKP